PMRPLVLTLVAAACHSSSVAPPGAGADAGSGDGAAQASCSAQASFVSQCLGDAGDACKAAYAASCADFAAHLGKFVTDAIVGCAGYYVCGSDLFQVGGCVDRALVDARLTSAQEQALTDLCTACKISVIRCQQHTDTNGAHRLGAGVVFASDP